MRTAFKNFLTGRTKILLIILLPVIAAGLYYRHWVIYIAHLASHQYTALFNRVELSEADLKPRGRRKADLIAEARSYGSRIFGLESSNSFTEYVDLQRDTLGYNLTIAYRLQLKPVKFSFPLIGSFSYIGFFDAGLKDRWARRFKEKNYDVHESQIGAYSTLGWFDDPVYSTYLEFSDFRLVTIVLHEMAHEKLFFTDDTAVSESLASFIDQKAAVSFYKTVKGREISQRSKDRFNSEINSFNKTMNRTRQRLEKIFADSALTDAEKTRKKQLAYQKLQKELRADASEYRLLHAPQRLSEMTQLNNAVFLQYSRYNPGSDNGLDLIWQSCRRTEAPFRCYFSELEKLKSCPSETRYLLLKQQIRLPELIEKCGQTG